MIYLGSMSPDPWSCMSANRKKLSSYYHFIVALLCLEMKRVKQLSSHLTQNFKIKVYSYYHIPHQRESWSVLWYRVTLPFCKQLFHCVSPSLLQVHSVAWSCDGSRLASGSFDKTVTIWSLESDRLVQLPTLPLPLLLPSFYPLPFALRFFFAASHLIFPLTCSPHVSPLTHFFSIFPPFFLLIPFPLSLSLVPLPMFPYSPVCSFSPSLVWCQSPCLWFVSSLALPLVLSPFHESFLHLALLFSSFLSCSSPFLFLLDSFPSWLFPSSFFLLLLLLFFPSLISPFHPFNSFCAGQGR